MVFFGNAFDQSLALGLVRFDFDEEQVGKGGKIPKADHHQEAAEQRSHRDRQSPQ
jgi:hypothetical protein